jgi:peptide/nickel transport system permease protein
VKPDERPAPIENPATNGDATDTPVRSRRALQRLRRDRIAVACLGFIGLLVLIAIFGPLLTKDPNAQSLLSRLAPPSRDHWLGTDTLGRDSLARLVYGARVTLLAAGEATLVAIVLGVPIGLVAGYAGRLIDGTANAISDAVMSIPPLLLALVIVGVLGPGLSNSMIAVGVIIAPRFFRIARGAAQDARSAPHVEAARSIGCTPFRLLWRHVLPNSAGPLLVQTSFSIGLAVVAEASLSFLGMGVQQPTASWGSMVQDAFQQIQTSSFGLWAPSIMITLTILAFSLLGDGIRDLLGRERQGK